MIVAYPESPMDPPYRGYVRRRAAVIAAVLEDIVKFPLQLPPSAMTPDKVKIRKGVVYGCVLDDIAAGHKSSLYDGVEGNAPGGRVINSMEDGEAYIGWLLANHGRVRIKDPTESDSLGQETVSDIDDARKFIGKYAGKLASNGLVVMPHLDIEEGHRYGIGMINMGSLGKYLRIGREFTAVNNDGETVRGGGDMMLMRLHDEKAIEAAAKLMDVPQAVVEMGRTAISSFIKREGLDQEDPEREGLIRAGFVSVDVVEGKTDKDKENLVTAVIDITTRVNGFTPEEALGLWAFYHNKEARIVRGYDKAYYRPEEAPGIGQPFLQEEGLVVEADLTEIYTTPDLSVSC